jgi:hypothetical protein
MVEAASNLRMVNPRGTDLAPGDFRLNQRPHNLNGVRLGLLENSKANSDKVLYEVGEILKQKYDIKEVRYFSKHNASLPTKAETIDDILQSVDALVVGIGD